MAPQVSDDLKECMIYWYYINKKTMEEIRDLSRCSIGLVYKVIRNFQDFGQVVNPFASSAMLGLGQEHYGTLYSAIAS